MSLKSMFQQIKNEFSLKIYFMTCVSLMLLTLFLPVSAVADGSNLYRYRIGIGVPWVTIYKNVDLGICNFIDIVKSSGYVGIEWMPQNLLLPVLGVYVVYIWIVKNRTDVRHLQQKKICNHLVRKL